MFWAVSGGVSSQWWISLIFYVMFLTMHVGLYNWRGLYPFLVRPVFCKVRICLTLLHHHPNAWVLKRPFLILHQHSRPCRHHHHQTLISHAWIHHHHRLRHHHHQTLISHPWIHHHQHHRGRRHHAMRAMKVLSRKYIHLHVLDQCNTSRFRKTGWHGCTVFYSRNVLSHHLNARMNLENRNLSKKWIHVWHHQQFNTSTTQQIWIPATFRKTIFYSTNFLSHHWNARTNLENRKNKNGRTKKGK